MKIIICGAGDVGYHLAKMLSSDEQDIYLIDANQERLNYVQSNLDVYTIKGDAKSISILKEAKVEDCDLIIAATSAEETNLLICIIGKQFGAKQTIARVGKLNMDANKRQIIETTYKKLGVDQLISPAQLAAEEIFRLIQKSAFTDDYKFQNGKLSVFGVSVGRNSKIKDKTVTSCQELNPNLNFKPIALHRNEETIVINGQTEIYENDIIYFISCPDSIDAIIKMCGREDIAIKDIMILGGSTIGVLVAEMLEKDFNVTLIEKNRTKCHEIADKLKNTLVINTDGHDVTSLEEEGLAEMDAFIAVTGDSETNIMTSLVAKNHGVRKTIARVENIDYIHLTQNIGIDTLINKKIIAAGDIFKYVRKGDVDAIASLHGVDAEIIEFNVKPTSKVTEKQIKDLQFPKGANIAGVIRNDKGFIPFGDFKVEPNDKAIVFTKTDKIKEVERFFQ